MTPLRRVVVASSLLASLLLEGCAPPLSHIQAGVYPEVRLTGVSVSLEDSNVLVVGVCAPGDIGGLLFGVQQAVVYVHLEDVVCNSCGEEEVLDLLEVYCDTGDHTPPANQTVGVIVGEAGVVEHMSVYYTKTGKRVYLVDFDAELDVFGGP